jgi:hypothetical protein
VLIQLILDKDKFVVHHLFHKMEEDEQELIIMMILFDHYRKIQYDLEIFQLVYKIKIK